MRATRRIALAGLCCVIITITACATGGAPTVSETPATYVVLAHDTLYSIAWRHDLDYHDLARWNNIGADYRLSIGQVLTLRPPAGSATRGAAPPPAAAPRREPRSEPRNNAPQPAAPGVPPPPHAVKPPLDPAAVRAHWVWPTDPSSPARAVPGGGILLFGELGQDIRAAGAGRVVYTGSGIRGYGNLIIIKHGETLLSAYAHNREMLVHEGQEVAAGQLIAHMGVGPHQVSALYFEIRVNGKPIDPSPYLPAP